MDEVWRSPLFQGLCYRNVPSDAVFLNQKAQVRKLSYSETQVSW